MAVDADWISVVGETKTLEDGGFIGDLMSVAAAHIDEAVSKGQITQENAGEVYIAMLPAAFKEGISYFLQLKQIKLGIIPSTLGK